ncbi:MAG TPA: DUF2911 domain-containing protein [Gemmatimonadaceae bacterium]|nr:DUF2911 domain-containing protein [Gemmatimonadaceae bacterium]
MKRFVTLLLILAACGPKQPEERYGFITRLGNDTISVESVSRRGSTLISDEADRFPRVNQRHTEIELADDGSIRHLEMDIHTPSEPENQRDRHVVADVTPTSVHVTKKDGTGKKQKTFETGGGIAMAHVPQMYSLYELYFANALARAKKANRHAGDTIQMRQFYLDREFDNFPLHHGIVRLAGAGKAEISHDWLAGIGEAKFDSANHMLSYSGARTTYKVDVVRVTDPPDVTAIGERFAAMETQTGGVKSLSVRDTTRAIIGGANFMVDYGRPLARGRVLLGNIIPYDRVWRTGANAATQFSASRPITLAGIKLPAGMYTLWTIPHTNGVELIVNKQTGQWGTGYNPANDLGKARMIADTTAAPVEKFSISVVPAVANYGSLVMEWGPFRWTAPIVVQ